MAFNLLRLTSGFAMLSLLAAPAACRKEGSDSGGGNGAATAFELEPSREGYFLLLKHTALEQPFLLLPASSDGPPFALSYAQASRIVRFERDGEGNIALYEDARGVVAADDIPTYRLLAKFAVLADDGNTYKIDFDKGIRSLLASSDTTDDATKPEIYESTIKKAYVKEGKLFVDQVVSVRFPPSSAGYGAMPAPAQLKYSLMPYAPSAEFTGLDVSAQPLDTLDGGLFGKLPAPKRFGFFTTPSFGDSGRRSKEYANRWDTRGPITFHVSASTPEQFKQAVKDGALYWNKAFGSEIVKVEDAPADVTPHEPGYNVIQWVDWDDMGFAYADFATDSVTAQTLQAQVYLSSIFAVSSRGEAVARMAGLDLKPALTKRKQLKPDQEGAQKFLSATKRGHRCFDNAKDLTREALAQLVADPALPDDAFLKFSQDYVRSVVAHEIGHTLGLRHNFAAKHETTLAPSAIDATMDTYFKTGDVAEQIVPASSVMDYLTTDQSVLQGAKMRLGHDAASYDKAAIGYGYLGADWWDTDFGSFCSDEAAHFMAYFDCVPFAAGGTPIAGQWQSVAGLGKRLGRRFAAKFLGLKDSGSPTFGLPIANVPLNPESAALSEVFGLDLALVMLREDVSRSYLPLVTVEGAHDSVSALNLEARKETLAALRDSALDEAGGYEGILAQLVPEMQMDGTHVLPFLKPFLDEVATVTAGTGYQSGTDSRGASYSFTTAEIAEINDRAASFAAELSNQFVDLLVSSPAFSGTAFPEGLDEDELASGLTEVARAIVTAKTAKSYTGTVEGQSVTATAAHYSLSTRIQALNLLSDSQVNKLVGSFNAQGRSDVAAELYGELDALTDPNGDGNPVDIDDLPDGIRTVAAELNEVLKWIP